MLIWNVLFLFEASKLQHHQSKHEDSLKRSHNSVQGLDGGVARGVCEFVPLHLLPQLVHAGLDELHQSSPVGTLHENATRHAFTDLEHAGKHLNMMEQYCFCKNKKISTDSNKTLGLLYSASIVASA